ncbi:hypothetical protein [Galbibacter sp. PAP.153]|uniref:hypothetical protein n=1 Tax=Galbibacter sp. PAP.153 TaxID=3104623 RepID=UPI00300960D8
MEEFIFVHWTDVLLGMSVSQAVRVPGADCLNLSRKFVQEKAGALYFVHAQPMK